MKKVFHKLHLWISIPFGIIISVLCLTGSLLVFESEIKEICSPYLYKANMARETPLPIEELMPIVRQQLPDSVVISNVQIPANPKNNYRMGVAGQGRTFLLVDPYTGKVKGSVNPYAKDGVFSVVRRTHRWLMFPHKKGEFSWGKIITGTATLMFVFILISGIIIWVPKTIKMVKTRLKIHTGLSRFRFWYDTHIAGGMYVILLLLVMSLTALNFSFDWYRKGFYAVFGVRTEQSTHTNPKPAKNKQSGNRAEIQRSGEREKTNYAVWSAVITNLKEVNLNYKSISIQDGSASVSINSSGNIRASDNYSFHPDTGEITDIKYYKDQPKSAKMRGWVYSVHVGTWGGWTTRILYFIACLIGTALPWTGYYIYLKKWRVKRKKFRTA